MRKKKAKNIVCQHFKIGFKAAAEQGGENLDLQICFWQSSPVSARAHCPKVAWTLLWGAPSYAWWGRRDQNLWANNLYRQYHY